MLSNIKYQVICRRCTALCFCLLYFNECGKSCLLSRAVWCFSKINSGNKSVFGLSQLNCRCTTTDGLTALTPSPSTLPSVITFPSPHLTFSPRSHPSCFSLSAYSPNLLHSSMKPYLDCVISPAFTDTPFVDA